MAKEQEPTYNTIKTFVPQSAKQVYDALLFAKNAFNKEEDFLYVLDTNALLKLYSFDVESFDKLKEFAKSHKMYATHTIEIEFIRNREFVGNYNTINVKKSFLEKLEEFKSEFSGSINEYAYAMNEKKDLLGRLHKLQEEYKKVKEDVSKYVNSISDEDVEKAKMECFKWIVDNVDFSMCLGEKQYADLKQEFEELFKKSKDKNNKESLPFFPGRGEKKQINEYGDYFIFHELLELAKREKKSVVFLTNDVTKDDWVDCNGKTFESYQIMFFAITKRSFKVQKYDDFLKAKVAINPQALLESEKQSTSAIYNRTSKDIFLIRVIKFEKLIIAFLREKGFHDCGSPLLFLKKYGNWVGEDFVQQLRYVTRCRNYLVNGYELNVDFDLALEYLDRLEKDIERILDFIIRHLAFNPNNNIEVLYKTGRLGGNKQ